MLFKHRSQYTCGNKAFSCRIMLLSSSSFKNKTPVTESPWGLHGRQDFFKIQDKVQNNDKNVSFMGLLGPSTNPNVHTSCFLEGWLGAPDKETQYYCEGNQNWFHQKRPLGKYQLKWRSKNLFILSTQIWRSYSMCDHAEKC